ncbi:uncharacterized protein NPIL_267621 [Nephila pilipes]|uniref:Peptidase aspartic putative domain-containing protein n=1 Tax=Nephila pilipes TaxID=299642 RepID=A0A8X6T3V6_NEPPI|nr:uncharacterized protein NPIL_267621 [Nephila pilipes]
MYDKLKELVLKEFQSTPQEVLNNFRKAKKRPNESYIQFASRLSAAFDYYCQLRKVNDFKGVCELMVSEKIFDSLDRELQIHIGVKQGESWYVPPDLARHCDINASSKFKNDSNVFSKPQVVIQSQKYRKEYSPQKVFVSEVKTPKCVVCKSNENHSLNVCPLFKNMLVKERIEVVKNKQLCFNCLNHHKVANCYSKSNCYVCKRRHNTLLHIKGNATEARSENESLALNPRSNVFVPRIENPDPSINSPSNVPPASTTHSLTATSVNANKMVLLSTAKVMIQNSLGIFTSARALLDVSSMSHFLSKRLADKLNLKKQKRSIVVSGLNQFSSVVNRIVKTKISNVSGSFEKEIELLVVPEITDHLPSRQFDINTLELGNFKLADVSFNKPGEVDILLGAQIFYELLRTGQIRFPDSEITFQNTVFGYVATGSVPIENKTTFHCGLIIEDLDANLRKLRKLKGINYQMRRV